MSHWEYLFLYPASTWPDVWGMVIESPAFMVIMLAFLCSIVWALWQMFRHGLHKHSGRSMLLVVLLATELIIFVTTFTHLGAIHGWEVHVISEGAGLAFLGFSFVNLSLTRVLING